MTDRASLPNTTTLLEQGIDQGLHIGAQLYISQNASPLADLALGQAAPGIPMTTETLMLWLSAGKPLTAAAVCQLAEQGLLDLDTPVAHYLPAFAAHGKDAITPRHILTHTGGFRVARTQPYSDPWDHIIDAICDVRPEPNWTPGEKAGYHAHTGWFILGQLIHILTGEELSPYFRDHILKPIGMTDSWIGMDPDRYADYGNRLGVMMDTSKNPPQPYNHHLPAQLQTPRPSSNATGPIRELARFYEMLLAGGEIDGQRILQPQTVRDMTSRQRVGMFDHTFKRTIDWGLGFIIDSKYHDEGQPVPYGYGPHASHDTFGHSGFQSSAAFADPAHNLVVAIVCNGTPGEQKHRRRMNALLKAVYEDLSLD